MPTGAPCPEFAGAVWISESRSGAAAVCGCGISAVTPFRFEQASPGCGRSSRRCPSYASPLRRSTRWARRTASPASANPASSQSPRHAARRLPWLVGVEGPVALHAAIAMSPTASQSSGTKELLVRWFITTHLTSFGVKPVRHTFSKYMKPTSKRKKHSRPVSPAAFWPSPGRWNCAHGCGMNEGARAA